MVEFSTFDLPRNTTKYCTQLYGISMPQPLIYKHSVLVAKVRLQNTTKSMHNKTKLLENYSFIGKYSCKKYSENSNYYDACMYLLLDI